jgi:hypothetical protein
VSPRYGTIIDDPHVMARACKAAASCASNLSACGRPKPADSECCPGPQPNRLGGRRAGNGCQREEAQRYDPQHDHGFPPPPRTPYGAAMDAIPPSPVRATAAMPLVQVTNLH